MNLKAAWASFRKRVAQLRNGKPGWRNPPKSPDHATYRDQYEKLLPVLPGLPRGDNFEERKAFLYLAELLIGLHNYGDDPILPPGVKRIVERVKAEELAPVLVKREGGYSPARFFSGLAGGWQIWAGAIVVLLAGLGVQTARLENAKHNEQEARRTATANARAADDWRERAGLYEQAVTDAREAAQQSAADLDRERAQRARAAAAERRRQREIQNILVGSPEPPAWSLRDDGTSEPTQPAPGN